MGCSGMIQCTRTSTVRDAFPNFITDGHERPWYIRPDPDNLIVSPPQSPGPAEAPYSWGKTTGQGRPGAWERTGDSVPLLGCRFTSRTIGPDSVRQGTAQPMGGITGSHMRKYGCRQSRDNRPWAASAGNRNAPMSSFAVLLFVGGPARSDKHQYGRPCQKGVVAVSCVLAAQLPHRTSGQRCSLPHQHRRLSAHYGSARRTALFLIVVIMVWFPLRLWSSTRLISRHR